jgi:hypothetical protein
MALSDLNRFLRGWIEIRLREVLNFEGRMNTGGARRLDPERSLTIELHVASSQ